MPLTVYHYHPCSNSQGRSGREHAHTARPCMTSEHRNVFSAGSFDRAPVPASRPRHVSCGDLRHVLGRGYKRPREPAICRSDPRPVTAPLGSARRCSPARAVGVSGMAELVWEGERSGEGAVRMSGCGTVSWSDVANRGYVMWSRR